MTEAEIFNNFYEGMTSESKDLVNSSSGRDFSRLRVSEAKRIINRLIDAKKAYDNPRAQSNRRAPVHAATDQIENKLEARMNRLEKTVFNALEKNNQPAPTEKCQAPLGQEESYPHPYYGQPPEMENFAQVNTARSWNANGSWNPGKQRDAHWRDHPNFRWSDANPNQPAHPSYQNTQEGPPGWSSRNPANSYVPPHQRGFPGENANHQGVQGSQGQNINYNQNQGLGGNFHHPQGSGPYNSFQGNSHYNQGPGFNHQGAGSSQPYPKQQNRPTDDLVGDLLNSQQHLQSNMQPNNDVVHKLQDAQLEQKAAMDMMAKQLSQIATSLNEMRGNDGKIPATVKMPARENISKITLRSGKAYDEPKMRTEGDGEDGLIKQTGQARDNYDLRKEDLLKPLPPMTNPFFLDQEP
ncbi:hypothetical protein AAHA92_01176 [Salvia divinorum]|uniref:Uncharacterized protein n=1 Tax=Salvia divinorum TaxID=28513 RepID=A0ABD1IMN7_SALDI